jgi:predicted acylesterase/phospholipase RssA
MNTKDGFKFVFSQLKMHGFNTVVISGGSVKGFAVLGAIYEMENKGILNLQDVNTYVGVSSGSLMSLLFVVGFTPMQIIQKVLSSKVFDAITKSINFGNVWNGLGAFSYEPIHNFMLNTIVEKIGYIPTMKDVRERLGKRLIIISYNETEEKTVVFDSDNSKYNDLSTLVLTRCSSNLPWFFSDFNVNGINYTDGGLVDNFPVHLVDNGNHRILGFVNGAGTINTSYPILNKIFKRLRAPITNIVKVRIEGMSPRCKIVRIETPGFNVHNLDITNSQILDLIGMGKTLVKNIEEDWEAEHQKKD